MDQTSDIQATGSNLNSHDQTEAIGPNGAAGTSTGPGSETPDLSLPDRATPDGLRTAMRQADATAAQQLESEWGGEFDQNVGFARQAAEAFGSPALIDLLENTTLNGRPLGDHPTLLRVAAQIGRQMTQGSAVPIAAGQGAAAATTDPRAVSHIEEQLTDLTTKIHDAHAKGDHRAVERLSQQRAALADRLFGGGAIVGAPGRVL